MNEEERRRAKEELTGFQKEGYLIEKWVKAAEKRLHVGIYRDFRGSRNFNLKKL